MTRNEFISLLEQDGFTYCFDYLYEKEVGTEFQHGFVHTTFEVDEDVAVRRVICHTWQPATKRLMESVSESLVRYRKKPMIGADIRLRHIGQIYTYTDFNHYIYPEDTGITVEGN